MATLDSVKRCVLALAQSSMLGRYCLSSDLVLSVAVCVCERQLLSGELHNRCGNATLPQPWTEEQIQSDYELVCIPGGYNMTCNEGFTCGYG